MVAVVVGLPPDICHWSTILIDFIEPLKWKIQSMCTFNGAIYIMVNH